MRREQLIVWIVGITIVVALYQLPKYIVANKDKQSLDIAQANNATQSNQTQAKPPMQEGHKQELSQEDTQKVALFRTNFWKQTDKQAQWADSLQVLFTKNNLWDSAAHYQGIVAEKIATQIQWLKAGNAYYDAFGFAVKPDKAKALAQKARSFFQKVLDKAPDHAEANVKMGMTYTLSENPMQGILMIRKVLEREPNNTLALMSLGLLSMQSKQYDKAIERFEKLTQIEPQNFEAKIYLAESYVNLNKKDKAINLLKIIQKDAPDANLRMAAADFIKQLNP